MPNIISNASGAINITVAITQAMVADQYKLTYNCSNVGDGKSFLLITGDNTYFFPLQFTGKQEILFNADFGSLIQCVLYGNASISGLTLSTNDTLSDDDRKAIELVKSDSDYWGKIKDIIDDLDNVRAEKMAGILNMTLNSFANENGTITQKNGIMTWMNGTSYETATEAVRVSGGAIGVSNQKDGNGDWIWSTAITGTGINAKAIVAKTFDALEITGSKIVAGSITGSTVTGVEISGSTIISGTVESGNYITIDSAGNIWGFKNHNMVLGIEVQNQDTPLVTLKGPDGSYIMIGPNWFDGRTQFGINCHGGDLMLTTNGFVHISGDDHIEFNGDVKFYGNIYDRQGRVIWGEGE